MTVDGPSMQSNEKVELVTERDDCSQSGHRKAASEC